MVEVTGLEPAASWSQTKHSTKLSYTSLTKITTQLLYYYLHVLSSFFTVIFEFDIQSRGVEFLSENVTI